MNSNGTFIDSKNPYNEMVVIRSSQEYSQRSFYDVWAILMTTFFVSIFFRASEVVHILKLYTFIFTIYTLSSLYYFECHWFQLVSASLNALNMFKCFKFHIQQSIELRNGKKQLFISSLFIYEWETVRTNKWRKSIEWIDSLFFAIMVFLVPVPNPYFNFHLFMKTS